MKNFKVRTLLFKIEIKLYSMMLAFTQSNNTLNLINVLPVQQEQKKLLCKTPKEN